jgi:two-component system, cell cycle response regulator DivK
LSNGAPASAARVLIVDDVQDNREMYTLYLQHVGFHVETAADGREGLRKAHALRPNVIILDLSMPLIDGWTLCRALKGNPRTRRIPVIALSGFADPNSRQRAQAAGVDAFLSKPCLPDELVREIRRRVPVSLAS